MQMPNNSSKKCKLFVCSSRRLALLGQSVLSWAAVSWSSNRITCKWRCPSTSTFAVICNSKRPRHQRHTALAVRRSEYSDYSTHWLSAITFQCILCGCTDPRTNTNDVVQTNTDQSACLASMREAIAEAIKQDC